MRNFGKNVSAMQHKGSDLHLYGRSSLKESIRTRIGYCGGSI